MKKKLSALAVLCAALCVLAGCGSNSAPAATTTAAAGTTAAPAEAADPVLYDANGIKIISKGFGNWKEYFNEFVLELGIENNTGKTIGISFLESSINKRMYKASPIIAKADGTFDIGFDFEIAPGESNIRYGLYLNGAANSEYDIRNLGETSFSMEITVGDDWEHPINTGIVTVKNPEAGNYVTAYFDEGVVAYDKGGIKIVVQDTEYDSTFWGPQVKVYAYNGTDKTIEIRMPEATLNGEAHRAFGKMAITPGCCIIDTLLFEDVEGTAPLGKFSGTFEIYEFDPQGEGALIDKAGPVTVEY